MVLRIGLVIATCLFPAVARAVPWPNPSGEIPGIFHWFNGQSDNGLFESPIITNDAFSFTVNNFRATSANGIGQTVQDRVFFQIELLSQSSLQSVELTPFGGDYAIVGGGTVSAESFLFVTNIDAPVNPPSNPLVQQASTNPNFPVVVATGMSEAGPWTTATALQAIPGADWRRFTFVFNLVVQAQAASAGSATIGLTPGAVTIRFNIPEPMAAAHACATACLMLRRRRRSGCSHTPSER